MNTHQTYFIRHTDKLDVDEATRVELWRQNKIAIHYPQDRNGKIKSEDNASLKLDDYEGKGRSCMKILSELAKNGGYVCAQHHQRDDLVLGIVRPQQIKLFRGKWGSKKGRVAILKSLHITNVKKLDPVDYAVLLVGRPRQGTVARWHRAFETKIVEDLVEGRKRNPELSDLHYTQQEILCSEFLRLKNSGLPQLAHLLLPTGQTMKDIDVIGIAKDGKRLLAQVTFKTQKESRGKLEQLKVYRKGDPAHLLFFCDCSEAGHQDGITVFPIKRAYDSFAASKLGKLWLKQSR
jgi:hypothetical protein